MDAVENAAGRANPSGSAVGLRGTLGDGFSLEGAAGSGRTSRLPLTGGVMHAVILQLHSIRAEKTIPPKKKKETGKKKRRSVPQQSPSIDTSWLLHCAMPTRHPACRNTIPASLLCYHHLFYYLTAPSAAVASRLRAVISQITPLPKPPPLWPGRPIQRCHLPGRWNSHNRALRPSGSACV